MSQKFTPALMFESKAEEAIKLYLSIFKNSEIVYLHRYGANEAGAEGTVLHAEIKLNGQSFIAMDSPIKHAFTFTPSLSIYLQCETVQEIDELFAKLSAGGQVLMELDRYPFSERYAWVADPFGVSWQLILGKTADQETLVIERVFDAPRELVWKAWTVPERMMRWSCPKGFTTPVLKIDLRVGGKYLQCMRSSDGQDYWSTGVYREISAPRRLVCSDSFADEHGNVVPASHYGMIGEYPDVLEVTVTLEELDKNRTQMTLQHAGIPEGEIREISIAGWNESLDKLAESLK